MEDYIELSAKAKEKGIKLIFDEVLNHCGSEH
jgi:glycosidase